MPGLKIADNLTLPIEIVGEANCVIGKRNSGKTYTAKKLVEEMLRLKQQVIICEPTDVWWGLRSSADSKGPGFPIAVFGGPHADLPLEPGSGTFMADLLVGEGLSAVLCLKPFSKTARRSFMADFAERLLQIVDHLMHVVLEEAHEWIPQRSSGETARMLGACSDLTTTGRTSGIGTTLVSQRPARIHKDPYEQTDNLIVHQLVGTNDRGAAESWVKAQDLSDEAREMMAALPKLKQGTAYCYAPALLGEPRFMDVRPITTFDSSATPKPGQKRKEPKTVADIDLEAVREAMADAIERAQADDPKHLRKRITELEKELTAAQITAGVSEAYENEIAGLRAELAAAQGRPSIEPDVLDKMQTAVDEAHEAAVLAMEVGAKTVETLAPFANVAGELNAARQALAAALEQPANEPAPPSIVGVVRPPEPGAQLAARPPAYSKHLTPKGSDDLTGPEQRVVDACAWLGALGIEIPSRVQVAMVAGYHPRTKGFTNALGALRSAGLVDYPKEGHVRLLEVNVSNAPPKLVTVEDLQAAIFQQVGERKARILRLLIAEYPSPLSRDALADALGYHPRTKSFTNDLGNMRSLGLIDYPDAGAVVALPVLFGRPS